MAFNDQEVNKQIQHMVSFIEQEAAEKANEILVKAEEEFNIEKGRIVQEEKLKVMGIYQKKEKQVDVQRKILYSNELNKNRLEVLQCKHNQVTELLDEVKSLLSTVTDDKEKYKNLLSALILEACYTMIEPELLLEVRETDMSLVESVFGDVQDKYKTVTKREVKLSFAPDQLPANSCGGVVVTTKDGRTRCDQTLEKRLDTISQT
eukprot:Ihof_evm6s274 gene=Ihof_evmTU6s274